MARRYLIPFLCSMGFTAPLCAGATEVDHGISLSVVQVHAYPGPGKVFVGSGVVVGPDRVATNCHVTRRAHSVVVSKGPWRAAAVSQQADVKRDLCLLDAPGIGVAAAKVGSVSDLSVGQPLYLYGYPRAIGIAFSQGQVEALHPYEGSLIIETSADFTSGASGGGLFDAAGRLMGLPTFLSAGHSGHYYAIPSDWITALTTAASRKIEPIEGSAFWENAAGLPPFLQRPDP